MKLLNLNGEWGTHKPANPPSPFPSVLFMPHHTIREILHFLRTQVKVIFHTTLHFKDGATEAQKDVT